MKNTERVTYWLIILILVVFNIWWTFCGLRESHRIILNDELIKSNIELENTIENAMKMLEVIQEIKK